MKLFGDRLSILAIKNRLTRNLGGTPVTDECIVFFMPVFRDAEMADRSLARVRRFYPTSRIVLVSDGDTDFPGDAFIEKFGVEYVAGDNLYGMHHRGATVQRMLAAYLRAPAWVLVRMNTDARMDRRFRRLPSRDGVFGTIGRRSGTLQGGCIVVSLAALGRTAERRLAPLPSGDRSFSRCDISRAADHLNDAVTSAMDVGIKRLAEWYLDVWAPLGRSFDLGRKRTATAPAACP